MAKIDLNLRGQFRDMGGNPVDFPDYNKMGTNLYSTDNA